MKNMTKYKTDGNWLFVEITENTQEEINQYYKNSGEFKSTGNSKPREFKTALILSTFDDEKYPVGTRWIMGESPGIKVSYRGDKITMITKSDIYARIIEE